MSFSTPTIPPLISSLFARFPLYTYPSTVPSSAPSTPTLWLLGPPTPSSPSNESLDPSCRFAQTLARFLGASTHLETSWRPSAAGSPGEKLPALHLPNGELMSEEAELVAWFKEPRGALNPSGSAEGKKAKVEPEREAFLALLRTTLLPAVLAAVYLAPEGKGRSVVPPEGRPWLASWVVSWGAAAKRRARVAELVKLKGRKQGVLDLEEVEREGVETLAALEEKIKKSPGGQNGWWNGASQPTELDAWIYSLCSIILQTPPSPLRDELDRSRSLVGWIKHHDVLKA